MRANLTHLALAALLGAAATGDLAAQQLGSGINNKWQAMGGAGGVLGPARTHELEAGRSPFGTTGRYALFNGGVIIWHRDGARAGYSFEVHGAIGALYQQMGGTGSWLGFPISDEYSASGGRRSDFEGGFIFWNTQSAQAYRNSGGGNGGTPANRPPVLRTFSYPGLPSGLGVYFPQLVTAAWDPDGDRITHYEIYDGNGEWYSGYWSYQGKPLAAGRGHVITVEMTRYIRFEAGRHDTTDSLWVRAYDGKAWSAWYPLSVTTKAVR